ncbi:MAG: hypothetical protein AAF391_02125 [Bacteroidota bacterium]
MEEIELIEQYIKGQLSDDEMKSVDDRLLSDPVFKESYEQQRALMEGIVQAERARLKNVLQNEDRKKFNYWYAVAAMIPLLIAAYFFIVSGSGNQELFDDYYEPYGVYEFGEVRGSDSTDTKEVEAFALYKNAQYHEALDGIADLVESNKKEGYYVYLAISQIELGQLDEASNSLDSVSSASQYFQIAQWYKALIYLKTDRVEEAKILLESLSKEKNGLAVKAQELRDQL